MRYPWVTERTVQSHAREFRYLLDRIDDGHPVHRDRIEDHLRHNGCDLEPQVLGFVADRYVDTVAEPIPTFQKRRYATAELARVVIGLHRAQLASPEYLADRAADLSGGRMDPVHAEDVADIAVAMARGRGFRGDALVLLRLASHLHDADRSFPKLQIQDEQSARSDPTLYEQYKAAHMRNCVARANDLLELAGELGVTASPRMAADLAQLIGRHELGGRKTGRLGRLRRTMNDKARAAAPEVFGRRIRGQQDALTDLLRDADSAGFLSTNILTYLDESGGDVGKLVSKIAYMFERMHPQNQRWIVERVVLSKTHVLGVNGERLTTDANVLATRAALRAYLNERHPRLVQAIAGDA
jgi:hypothetical protein